MKELAIAKRYAPILYFDRKEPFFPVRVGVTVLREAGASPSFRRTFPFHDERLDLIVEYAIYWDFDIQHLYELEHVWVYVAKDGSVLDAEASFHGKYFKGLLKDRSNLEDTHVILYSQPGKHAFSPMVELFDLIPDLRTCTDEGAGAAGLIITAPFAGSYETSEHIDQLVRAYLQEFRFQPSMVFERYEIPEEMLVPWEILRQEVPERIRAIVKQLEER
jgi:hypothetical protein